MNKEKQVKKYAEDFAKKKGRHLLSFKWKELPNKKVEISVYTLGIPSCDMCKRVLNGFTVPREEWEMVPEKLRKMALCKLCFEGVSNIKNPHYFTQKQLHNKKLMWEAYNIKNEK